MAISSLLSVEGQALRSWGQADRQALADKVLASLRLWEEAFHLGRTPADGVRCEAASDAASGTPWGPWHALSTGPEPQGVWWTLRAESGSGDPSADAHAALLAALFNDLAGANPASQDRMADQIAQDAWMDWLDRIGSLLGLGRGVQARPLGLPGALLRPWSGALILTLPWCGQTLALALDAACAARVLPPKAPPAARPEAPALAPLLRASAALPIPLRVEMEPLELDLGALTSLRVGDILRTSHALEAPLLVKNGPASDGAPFQPLCGGFLGRQGDQVAVELLRRA